VTARLSWDSVTITESGPVAESLDKAVDRQVGGTSRARRPRRAIAATAVLAGAGMVVLALVAGWGWLIPAVLALAFAAVQLWQHKKDKEQARADEQRARETVRTEAERAVAAYAKACAELTMRRAGIDEDLAALRTCLAGPVA
jgi:type III secretory pathway component EscV